MDELTRKHIKLVSPSLAFKQPYLELLEEQAQHGEDSFKSELPQEDFGAFLMELSDLVQGIDLPPGIVPMSTFWLVDSSSTILGKSVVRHALTPALEHHGGHIGYVIRPSKRRQGYGTLILALTLEKARKFGLTGVWITCDVDNIGSVKVIENNQGVLSATYESEITGKRIAKYWIGL